jgi:hypothetical protein
MSNHTHAPAMFLERYLNGEVLAEDIDDFIDLWHENPEGREIYEFLGMSEQEYSLWVRDPDTLPQIARSRRTRLPLEAVFRATLEEFPIAARSANATKVDRLMRWLQRAGKNS